MSHNPGETRSQRRARIHNWNAVEAARYARLPEHREGQKVKRLQREIDARNRAEKRYNKYPPPAAFPDKGPNATELSVDLLRSGVFGIGRMHVPDDLDEPPPLITKRFKQGRSNTYLLYAGPELCQGHLSVYLAILTAARGMSPEEDKNVTLYFTTSELARAAGWADKKGRVSGRSLKKVCVAIKALKKSTIEHTWGGCAAPIGVSLLSFYEHKKEEQLWQVQLNTSVLQLFRLSKQINLKKRSKVADGLESWLYCYLRASAAFFNKTMTVTELYEASAATGDKKDFSKAVAAALAKLVDRDLIVYQAKTGPGAYEIEF